MCKNAEFVETAWAHIEVVIEHLEEIQKKVRKAGK